MIITYLGAEFFKLQFGDITLATNPISRDSKLKSSRFGADIALVSIDDVDTNGAAQLSHGERQPFVISGPGEYEIKGIEIRGFLSKSNYKKENRNNTIFLIRMDNIEICYLGALSGSIPKEVAEELDSIDILILPIGGEGVLNAKEAYKIGVELEPKMIIPMHYEGIGEKEALKIFKKEGGQEDTKAIDKLTVKLKDLEQKEDEIVILAPTLQ